MSQTPTCLAVYVTAEEISITRSRQEKITGLTAQTVLLVSSLSDPNREYKERIATQYRERGRGWEVLYHVTFLSET